ncbi:MAG: plasmid replication initiator RepA, partial [Paracoccaceae bacterium]
MLREIIAKGHLPDYTLTEEPGDIIAVRPMQVVEMPDRVPQISPRALEQARALVPGADIYALEADWRAVWAGSGRPRLRNPDKAFLGWLRKNI